MSATQVHKQRTFALLASKMADFQATTAEYERLLHVFAEQHKILSEMSAWHAAQFMACWKLVLLEEQGLEPSDDGNDSPQVANKSS